MCARLLQIFPFIFRGLEERRSAEVVSLTPPAERRISFAVRCTSLPPPAGPLHRGSPPTKKGEMIPWYVGASVDW